MFAYAPSRSTATANELYAGARPGAVLMTDGYEPYDTIADRHGLVHLGCWVHARRRFHEALRALPKGRRGPEQLPARFIDLIGKLYHVEAEAARAEVDVIERGRRRRELSAPVLQDIERLLLANLGAVLPKSLLGQALHYLSSQWPKLIRFVDDGRCSLDNNGQETPFVRSASDAETGCSPTPWPGRTRARTCTRCCRHAWSTASMLGDTCVHCSSPCPQPRPSMTTQRCCPGGSVRPQDDAPGE